MKTSIKETNNAKKRTIAFNNVKNKLSTYWKKKNEKENYWVKKENRKFETEEELREGVSGRGH